MNQYIAHSGVKGMKWGRRKARKKKPNVKKMTNADLEAKINRLQAEKKYKELAYSKRTKATVIATAALAAATTSAASVLAKKYAPVGIEVLKRVLIKA